MFKQTLKQDSRRGLALLCGLVPAMTTPAWAGKGNPVKVKSGDLKAVLAMKERATLEIDYSRAMVGDIDDGEFKNAAVAMPIEKYLESKGADYVRDWPSEQQKARDYFIKRFNKKNKKGLQVTNEVANYTMRIVVEKLDFGKYMPPAPFVPNDAGGAVYMGRVQIVENGGGQTLCELEFGEVKGQGVSVYTDAMRLGYSLQKLDEQIVKAK